jgi:hypothetical protein
MVSLLPGGASTMRGKYRYVNVGEMIARKREIDERANQLMDNTADPFSFGQIDALREMRDTTHSKIVAKLVTIKKEIDNINDSQFLDFEEPYLRGYLNGLETILNIDRSLFGLQTNFVFFIFAMNESIADRYNFSFAANEDFVKFTNNGKRLQYYVTTTEEDLKNAISRISGEDFVVALVYEYGVSFPPLSLLEALSQVSREQIFLIRENENVSIDEIIKRVLKSTMVDP